MSGKTPAVEKSLVPGRESNFRVAPQRSQSRGVDYRDCAAVRPITRRISLVDSGFQIKHHSIDHSFRNLIE